MLTISGIVLAYVLLTSAQRHGEPHKEYTIAGRERMRGSSGSFMLYSLLVKCQFKECSAAALCKPRVRSTFLYLLITLKVTRAMCTYVRTSVCVCVCVCVREREREIWCT
jgi:hypothetical protein